MWNKMIMELENTASKEHGPFLWSQHSTMTVSKNITRKQSTKA
jgi:hypothetical protein